MKIFKDVFIMILFKKLIVSLSLTFLLSFNAVCLAEETSTENDYSVRIAYYTMMIEQNPNNGDMYFNRALAYTKMGGIMNAINDYSKAIELNENDAEAYFNRGFLYTISMKMKRLSMIYPKL